MKFFKLVCTLFLFYLSFYVSAQEFENGPGSILRLFINRGGKVGVDVSEKLKSLIAKAYEGNLFFPRAAQDYVYLFVGGLFTENYPKYFNANIEHLENLGLICERVQVDTGASVSSNAEKINEAAIAFFFE